jgi:hypothetical protein
MRPWIWMLPLALVLGATDARACKPAPLPRHFVDSGRQATDAQPPALVGAPRVRVTRGMAPPSGTGCLEGSVGGDCSDLGQVTIEVPATDDQTPASEIGFRVMARSGQLPPGMALPSGDVRARDGQLHFDWLDGATEDHPAISFVLAIAPIDAAGNVGPFTDVLVSDGGSGGGCALASGRPRLLPPALLLLFWAGLRARPRRPR